MNDKLINRPVDYEGAEEILHGRFEGAPYASPVQPNQLTLEDKFQFRCHPGIACFNECCRNIDITIMPYDIVRLKQRLGVTSSEFVARYTLPYEMDHHGMVGLKMRAKDLHELLRAWENYHRLLAAFAHMKHIQFREESRYPGYYYRTDFLKIDDDNWKCFVNSTYDRKTGKWSLKKVPFVQLVKPASGEPRGISNPGSPC